MLGQGGTRPIGLEPGPIARQVDGMKQRRPPELEMTIDGEFVSPRKAPIASRIVVWAVVVAVIAGALSLAAFALWIALLILPVAVGAALVAWAMVRYRIWRTQREMGSRRTIWRP
jgi:hypothetical protein